MPGFLLFTRQTALVSALVPTLLLVTLLLVLTAAPVLAQAPAAPLYPVAVAVHSDGTIYLADRNLPGLWKVAGGKPEIYFQASKQFRTPLNAVRSVAVTADGLLLVGDSATREVYRFNEQQEPVPLTEGRTGIPMGIAVNKAGDIFISDLEIHQIWKLPAAGGDPEKFAAVQAPIGLAVDAEDRLWVVSRGANQLVRIASDGTQEPVVTGRPFQFPHHVVVDSEGTAYVTDGYGKVVWRVREGQAPEQFAASELFANPVGLALDPGSEGGLLVVDPRAKPSLLSVDAEGNVSPRDLSPAE